MQFEVPPLTGRHVTLEPLAAGHVGELVTAAGAGDDSFAYTAVPIGERGMGEYVTALLDDWHRGHVVPFAQRRRTDGAVVGCTRFMTIIRWSGRQVPDEVEIGGTWLAGSAQRTPLNNDAKLLLLTHAFEVWGVHRVQIATDSRNERSRRAIERLGAPLEGILRQHRASAVAGEEGRPRDTAVYAIVAGEWPGVRDLLVERSNHSWKQT